MTSVNSAFLAAILTLASSISMAANTVDSNGILTQWIQPFPQPTQLSSVDLIAIRQNILKASIEDDRACKLSPKTILQTVLPLNAQADAFCIGHDREIVWSESTQGLYLCKQDRAVKAMRTSIGSNGLGKSIEGDRKTPIGSYWLGAPRKSDHYGLFIPVGFPNEIDLQAGRTGHSVGIHGPLRIPRFASACSVGSSLEKNWTAGCVAVARDSQIAEVAEWVIENWPVRFHILADKATK